MIADGRRTGGDTVARMPSGHAPFAVLNRTGNPILVGLLRSPLHRLVSNNLALITVTGRRSGKSRTFPVGYRRDGNRVTIAVGWPERKLWWRNLIGSGESTTRGVAATTPCGSLIVGVEAGRFAALVFVGG